MPCCSAYDALRETTPLEVTAATTTTTTGTESATIAPAQPYDCKNDGCFEELEGDGHRCPPGLCRRNEEKEKAPEHPRPRCANHDKDDAPRPFGTGQKK
jgi:hypothetical protein